VGEATFNAWKLVSLSPLPPWVLGLLLLGVAVGAWFAMLGVRKEAVRWRRWVLWTLRGIAAWLVVFLVVEPGIRDLQVARTRSRVAVLVDRSGSMGFPGSPGGPTRTEEVAEAIRSLQPRMEAQSDRFAFELLGFDPEVSPISPEALSTPATGRRTDLMSALRAVRAGGGNRMLSGVLLFSDGADHGALAEGAVGGARAALVDLGVPVNTVVVGGGALEDLAIERVRVDDFAFVRNSLSIDVELRGVGFEGQTVPVTLSREGQVVATRNATIGREADGPTTVTFTFTPDQTGRFVYTVAVPVFPQEAVRENNTRAFTLKVIRDRMRVLHVVGRPSWDERFLRGLLEQDANVDLVSFYILRTLADESNVINPERELSLIPFPMDEIFRQKLATFDVVILQNFGYASRDLSISAYEPDLVDYVKGGGSLIFIGGDAVLGAGEGRYPRLQEVLPVEPAGPPAEEPFVARLTEAGARHPVTSVATGQASSEAVWAALPPIPGANRTRLRSGATALLEHPGQKIDGKPLPIVAVWEVERGRVLTLATDGAWAWAFTATADGSPSRAYDRFVGNALRWLVRDPDLTTLNVLADPASVEPGGRIGAQVTVRDASYQPAAGANVRVELVDVTNGSVLGAQTGTTGEDGEVRVEFPPAEPGAYKLLAKAERGGQPLGEGEDAVAVRAVGPELADASVRPQLLREIAEVTGGRAQVLSQGVTLDVPLLEPPIVEVGRGEDRPLWDQPWALFLLVLVLGSEWFLRRRFGWI